MSYTVLSPWAESDYLEKYPLNPRIDDLKGKTVGLYASFKEYHPYFMREVERQLKEKYPDAKFSHYTYTVDTREIHKDPVNYPIFLKWLEGVDIVIGVGADAGSCALYMGYIFAHIERLGKPAVMYTQEEYWSSATRGAASRGVPGLRKVVVDAKMINMANDVDYDVAVPRTYGPNISKHMDELIAAITNPLTEEEQNPVQIPDMSNARFTGTLSELNSIFYRHGWTNGTPIVPPTEEEVKEFLKYTDLPRDYVVCELPPMMGKATVEKIAINGIIAGCLPTYLPVLIAAAKGMADPRIHLEGWTCSNAGWAPFIVISGPITKTINMNSGRNLMSPYFKSSSSIGRAVAYMIMNISGCRTQVEDMSGPGHESRFGACFAENIDESLWPPLHTDFGFEEGDSTVTLFWPCEHNQHNGFNTTAFLKSVCDVKFNGFDAGLALIIPPENARRMAAEGWSKKMLLDYIVEYARRPSTEVSRIVKGNNHLPRGLVLPAEGELFSARRYWNTDHMFVVVAGRDWVLGYIGGGDHGGPSCTKVDLPAEWNELAEKYKSEIPEFALY